MFAVFGNPVEHSLSPDIHSAFAAQRQQLMDYRKILATTESFPSSVQAFFAQGGQGANVTVPFKEQAFALCEELSDRAQQAGAVNTLWVQDNQLHGDNTDGAGLVRDLTTNLGWTLGHKRVLVLGAGGAVRGVLGPLLAQQPAQVLVANRTAEKALALATRFSNQGLIAGCSLDALQDRTDEPFHIIINGTSTGLQNRMPELPEHVVSNETKAYDMVYKDTPFLQWIAGLGSTTADGLGMLVEQAAEAFHIWHGWRPETASVITGQRAKLREKSLS